MKHVISPLDLSMEELENVLSLAESILQNPKKYSECCHGK